MFRASTQSTRIIIQEATLQQLVKTDALQLKNILPIQPSSALPRRTPRLKLGPVKDRASGAESTECLMPYLSLSTRPTLVSHSPYVGQNDVETPSRTQFGKTNAACAEKGSTARLSAEADAVFEKPGNPV